jgi:hypothetical protein
MLGGGGAADIISLIKGGYEVHSYRHFFKQEIDRKGKVTTKVYGGFMQLVLTQIPPNPIIEWALDSRKYMDGVIISVNEENIPLEKIIFKNATCVSFSINYTHKGDSYTTTSITIAAEELSLGNGVSFTNEWIQ